MYSVSILCDKFETLDIKFYNIIRVDIKYSVSSSFRVYEYCYEYRNAVPQR